jgi:hypothetical protein
VDSGESIREMDSMAQRGDQFYHESGELFKLVGILRAADVFWNPDKRQVYFLLHALYSLPNSY